MVAAKGQKPWRPLFIPVHASAGRQLSEITSLIESDVIRPVVDKVFPFERTGDALPYVDWAREGHGRHHGGAIDPVFSSRGRAIAMMQTLASRLLRGIE